MLDQGFTADLRHRLFQLKDQFWRACRVVIDVKLHTGEMTFDQAVDMLVEVAHLERPNAIGEVRRYTQSPTQPMSYLMGKHQILDLREREQRRGDGFILRVSRPLALLRHHPACAHRADLRRMMYLALKLVHVLAVIIFLGNITIGVFWKAMPIGLATRALSHTRCRRSSAQTGSSPFRPSSCSSSPASAPPESGTSAF